MQAYINNRLAGGKRKLMNKLPHKTWHQTIERPNWIKNNGREQNTLWLDKNECIDPLYHEMIMQWLTTLSPQALYAYPECSNLYHKLARFLNVSADNLIFAAGSDGIIRLTFETFIHPGDKVLFPLPTFAMYPIYTQIYGAKLIDIHYQASKEGAFLDTAHFIHLILTEQPKLICLANPDSPTGAIVSEKILHDIIQAANEVHAIVLIDEAYYPFYSKTYLPFIHTKRNVLIARTFSKAWGLAGIRLGYAAANSQLITQLHRIRPMYEIGNVSLTIAEKALDHSEEMLASVNRLLAGKTFFMEELKKLGFKVPANVYGNFLHVNFGKHASSIHAILKNKVLYRKEFSHPALIEYSRFSATTKEQFSKILELIKKADL